MSSNARGRATRERLLDAAEVMLVQHGWSVSVEQIATAAGVVRPTVYRHFADRDGLLTAMVLRSAQRLGDQLTTVLDSDRPWEEWLVDATLAMPTDDRARRVADSLLADATDSRTLTEWGHEVGASARTLGRLFAAETGMVFERWRTQARISPALPLLADGTAVATVGFEVVYSTPSAFVTAFRREFGSTPGEYFGRR